VVRHRDITFASPAVFRLTCGVKCKNQRTGQGARLIAFVCIRSFSCEP
jgi:hypothetical protein